MPEKLNTNLSEEANYQNMFWENMYQVARPPTRRRVWRAGIWVGQEEDVAADVVHDAIERLYRQMQQATEGLVSPVEHPERMILVIAFRCFLDRWRKDRRLVRFDSNERSSLEQSIQSAVVNPAEVALDIVYQSWLYAKVADMVSVKIPDKQRLALLRDLAQRMHFGSTLTPLQQAFVDRGLDLRQHQGQQSTDKRLYAQHASNLSNAYKKIGEWAKKESIYK